MLNFLKKYSFQFYFVIFLITVAFILSILESNITGFTVFNIKESYSVLTWFIGLLLATLIIIGIAMYESKLLKDNF